MDASSSTTRMIGVFSGIGIVPYNLPREAAGPRWNHRQRKVEGGAFAAIRPDSPQVRLGDFLRNRQSQPRSRRPVLGSRASIETIEDSLPVLRPDGGPFVVN